MNKNNEEIIKFIKANTDHPMKMKELAKALGVKNPDYNKFRNSVKSLMQTGHLVKLKRGRIGIADELNVKVGKISVARGGFGFLIVEDDPVDVFIPATKLNTALDGDRVMVRVSGTENGRPTGSVIKIVERVSRNIVGIFNRSKTFSFVVPDNKKIHRDIYIPTKLSMNAKDGQKVVCVIESWDDPYRNPEGEITEVLGFPGQPGVDMKAIIKTYQLPEEFPPEVLEQAEYASAKLDESKLSERLDLTKECIYTIDPVDAKDHDDAVSVKKHSKGYSLSVHIADVSHFVEEGSQLDKEALKRGNSVYLPGIVIPMLPELLSNNVCSLMVNKKRLAHSAFIEFDKQGKMISWKFADTIIKSAAKLSYEDVQEYFDSKVVTAKIKKVQENLDAARELAHLISNQRFAEGSLDFDLPESDIIMDDNGEVTNLKAKVRLESHRLVEEFMLVANKAVALEVFRAAQPFLYRVHEKPDIEKLTEFSAMMKRIGLTFPVSATMKPVQFSRFLERVKDDPKADFINELLLRSMKKAVYQRENIGHFGLAFKHYTHFTSPIRRYPDLVVHRLLRKLKNNRYPAAFAKKVPGMIDSISKHCSETERHAEKAERDAIKVKQMSFMAEHIGEEYDGVITGVMPYGFYVRLDPLGVEGLVRISSIDDDYYLYDEKHYRIVGRRNSKVYQLGDKIKIGITRVDKVTAEMDLHIVLSKGKKGKKTKARDIKPVQRKITKRKKR